eukprot:scpid63233/ scgid23223/ 
MSRVTSYQVVSTNEKVKATRWPRNKSRSLITAMFLRVNWRCWNAGHALTPAAAAAAASRILQGLPVRPYAGPVLPSSMAAGQHLASVQSDWRLAVLGSTGGYRRTGMGDSHSSVWKWIHTSVIACFISNPSLS